MKRSDVTSLPLTGVSPDLGFSPPPQDLQGAVQRQRADLDTARESLTALSRSHPSPELSRLSAELTAIAKGTEAAALRCNRTWGGLQAGLQLHFNGNARTAGVRGGRGRAG